MADDQRKVIFDRAMGALVGIPDVLSTAPTTIRATMPMIGDSQTFIVQTFRQRDDVKSGDTVFIEYVDADGAVRIVLPPTVAACIARQRDALTGRARSRGAKAAAADRKANGILPGFMRNRGKGGRRRKAR